MRRLLTLLSLLICLAQVAWAGTVEVTINLWSGECVLGNWAGYVTIAQSKLADAATGDVLRVTVSETSEEGFSQVCFNNASWAQLAGTEYVGVSAAPTTLNFTVTDETLAEIKSGSQIICKG